MNDVVLDASAILAIFFQERGAENLTYNLMNVSLIGAVNMAEVQTKLIQKGFDPEVAWEDAFLLVKSVVPFSPEQAKIAGSLITKTQPYGLSLGDRSCLALAISLNAPVYTTEQVWRHLDLGIPIHVIR